MRLRHLEVVGAIIRSRSMREASILLGVSQSAISQTLRHAEDALGYALFSREGRRLVPTPELRQLLPQIEQVFTNLELVTSSAAAMRGHRSARLSVCAIPALTCDWLARATLAFRDAHRHVGLNVLSMTPAAVLDSVLSHKSDIGLVHGPIHDPRLAVSTLTVNTVVVVLSRDHPLAGKAALTPRDLAGHDLITLSHDSMLTTLTSSAFRNHNVSFAGTVEMTAATSALVFVREGLGAALIDARTAATFQFADVMVRPFRPTIRLEAQCITAADRPLPLVAHDFLGRLRVASKAASRSVS